MDYRARLLPCGSLPEAEHGYDFKWVVFSTYHKPCPQMGPLSAPTVI